MSWYLGIETKIHFTCVPSLKWWAQTFEYLNKMVLKYYSYSYSCHFPSTNIFGYSFIDFWTTKYIQIFVCKFLKILIYLKICSEPSSNICLYVFNEKRKSRYNWCIKNIQYNILFRGSTSEPKFLQSLISMNIQIF